MAEQKSDQDDELALFLEEMADVTPKAKTDKADIKASKVATPGEEERRTAAVTEQEQDSNYLSTEHVDRLDPFDTLSFRREGVQHGVFKKLRLGRYPIDASLDLHRLTVAEAREEVFSFIAEAIKYDLRTVLILHGKGDRNMDDPALLKSYTAKWLTEIPKVMACHSAQQRDGGVGAVYVLLQKSEKLKGENRERYGLRS